MDIVLDTTCLHKDFFLKRRDLQELCTHAAKNGHVVYLPWVVMEEMKKHYREELESIQAQGDRNIKDWLQLTGEVNANHITSEKIRKYCREYSKKLKSRIRELGMTVLPMPEDSIQLIAEKAVNRKKPFEENGAGCPDALIWCSILQLAKRFSEKDRIPHSGIIFITNNHTDFCVSKKKRELHEDLKADLDDIYVDTNIVQVVADLGAASASILKYTTAFLSKAIKTHIAGAAFMQSSLISEIKDRLLKDLPFTACEYGELGFPACFESITIDSIYEDYTFEAEEVEVLGKEEIAIRFNVSVTCLFDMFIAKSEYYTSFEEDGPSVYDYDWNDHYVAAQDEKEVWFTVDLITDAHLSAIQHFEVDINETKNEELLPRSRSLDL